jgi:hypothetical protein
MNGDVDLNGDLVRPPVLNLLDALDRDAYERLMGATRESEPESYATRHHESTGHRLAYGCCSRREEREYRRGLVDEALHGPGTDETR